MSSPVFELYAKLGLDSKEFDSGLGKAKGAFSGIGGVAGAAMKGVGVAIAAGTAAVGAFTKSAISEGKQFDQSMSQVYATMGDKAEEVITVNGKTAKSMDHLRDFALKMGETTRYTAAESAEALNYMALAGYDAELSMQMLPNVMNLASAGAFDLARASDMITDTQTAFGISVERTTQMVDEMAKASSTGNTSVEQMGDAFLVVGALAKELNGGMVTLADGTRAETDGVQELEIALTAMANAGIKGSEAGTHMRNMILKLSSPTSEGAQAMEEYGIEVFDATGKMRSLGDIMRDTGNILGTMSQDEKLNVISSLFNTRDIASAEALMASMGDTTGALATTLRETSFDGEKLAESYSKINGQAITADDAISELAGAIVRMNTQGIETDGILYTLQKDFGLTAEEAQRAVDAFGNLGDVRGEYDEIGEALLSANEAGVMYNGTLYTMEEAQAKFGDQIRDTEKGFEILGAAEVMALKQMDNLAGDMKYMDSALSGLKIAISDQVTPALREFAQWGTQSIQQLSNAFRSEGLEGAMQALGPIITEGLGMILEGVPMFLDAGVQLVGAVASGIAQNIPALFSAATEIVSTILDRLISEAPSIIGGGVRMITELASGLGEALPVIIPKAIEAILTFAEGLVNNIDKLFDAGVQLVGAVASGIVQNIPVLFSAATEIVSTILDRLISEAPSIIGGGVRMITELASGLGEALPVIIPKAIEAILTFAEGLVNNIDKLLDAGGKIITGLIQGIGNSIPKLLKKAPEIITRLAQQITKGISKILTAGVNLLMGLVQAIPKALPKVISALPQIITGVVTFLTTNTGTIISAAVQLLGGLIQAVPQIIAMIPGAIMQIIAAIWQGFVDAAPGMLEAGKELLRTILDAIEDLIVNLPETAMGIVHALAEGILAGVDALFEVAQSIWDTLMGALSSLFGLDGENSFAVSGKQLIEGLRDGIKKGISKVVTVVSNLFIRIKTTITNTLMIIATTITQQWNNIKSVTSTVWNAVKSFLDSVMSSIKSAIRAAFDAIKTAISNAWEAIKTRTSTAWNAIKNAVQTAINAVKSVIETVMNAIRTVIETVWNAIKTVIETVMNAIKTIIETVMNGIKTVIETVWNAIRTVIETAMNAIKTVIETGWNAIQTAVSTALTAVQTAVSTAWNAVLTTTQTLWTSITTAISTAVENIKKAFTGIDWKSIGTNIINGIKDGVLEAAKGLATTVANAAKSALTAAKNAIGIKSPSKLFRDQVGKNIMEGWKLGILDGIPAVEKAISDVDLAASVVDTELPVPGLLRTVNDMEQNNGFDYKQLAEAFVNALDSYGLTVEMDRREFGRVVRRAMA